MQYHCAIATQSESDLTRSEFGQNFNDPARNVSSFFFHLFNLSATSTQVGATVYPGGGHSLPRWGPQVMLCNTGQQCLNA